MRHAFFVSMATSMAKEDFEVPVDDSCKCVEFKPFKMAFGFLPIPHCGKRRTSSPHMRAFWAATLAFAGAFIGWFAFSPLLIFVRKDIGICDNNDFVQLDIENNDCICKASCKTIITNANVCAVSFDILTRFLLGSVIERFGPANTDVMLLLWGSVVVGCSALVTTGAGLIAVRFFVSALGSTFVVNQFWNSIMFNRDVVGTVNATAGGWGNLGGGITQLLMPAIYTLFHDGFGLSLSLSWRMAMLVPATFYVFLAIWIYTCTQDMPAHSGRFDVVSLGKTKRAGPATYLKCLMDYRVFFMIMQYGACFGCELVMNTVLALHFSDNFDVSPIAAGAMAMVFGAMNLFARSLGGILSDTMNKRWAMSGRLWAHFLSLFGEALTVLLFGFMTKQQGVAPAIVVLGIFSIFVNMAEGTSYGIVPYMIPTELAVVSAMVGAGGTLGAPIALNIFFRNYNNFTAFKIYSGYVLFWALTVPLMRWDNLGSMFSGPKEEKTKALAEPAKPVDVAI